MTKHTPEFVQPQLLFGETQPQYITLHPRAKDITGQRFGRLVALGPVGKSNRSILWDCLCDCGNHKTVRRNDLRKEKTLSCGCLRSQFMAIRQTKHGMKKTRLYKRWISMIARCTNPSNPAYVNYGQRGICVCDEWRYNFKAYHDHVTVLPNYGEKGYSLDRINNDDNYEPGNVRWATVLEQNRNKRKKYSCA